MHIIQRDLGAPVDTFKAKYIDSGSDGAIAVGYVVAFDLSQAVTPAATAWEENARGNVVTKPKTANLKVIAGVVTSVGADLGDGVIVTVQPFFKGRVICARCHVNATLATTALKAANDDWGLVADASTTAEATLAIAAETEDTSTTAANYLVIGV